jgi:hypothetical protein
VSLTLEALEDRTLPNAAPVLSLPQTLFNVVKTTQRSLTASATDKDKGEILTFSLVNAPAGALITSTQVSVSSGSAATGTLTWTPTEDQGPASYTFSVVVTDNGHPVQSTSQAITVTTLAAGLVDNSQVGLGSPGQSLLLVGTSTNQGTATNPGNDTISVSSTSAASTVSATVNGATGTFTVPASGQIFARLFDGNDSFTLNEGTGSQPVGPPLSVDGGAGSNTLTVNGTASADAFTITDTTVGLSGAGPLTYTNFQTLNVNSLGGNDTHTMTSMNPNTVTVLDGGADADTFTGTFASGYNGSLTLINLETATMQVTGDLGGSLTVNNPGNLQSLSVTGTVTSGSTVRATNVANVTLGTLAGTLLASGGSVTGGNITSVSSTGLLKATEAVGVPGSGTLSGLTIGSVFGTVLGGSIVNTNIGSVARGALVKAAGQGTTDNVSIGTLSGTVSAPEDSNAGSGVMSNTTINSITSTGTVSTGSISGMSVGTADSGSSITAAGLGTASNVTISKLAGSLTAKVDTTPGSGTLSNISIGTLATTGTVKGANASNIVITSDGGQVNVSSTLTSLSAGAVLGTANLSAGHFNLVTAQHASPRVNFIEPTVTRGLALTPHTTGAAVPDYAFYYDGTGSSDPRVVIQIAAGSPANFDLALTTSTTTASPTGFDLAGLYSSSATTSVGVHNVVVGGDVLLNAVPAGALSFFNPPINATGGVQLPQDSIAVAAAGVLPAASIVAQSIMALAAGSFAGVSADVAANTDALVPLAPGTSVIQANDSPQVFFSTANSVAQFLVTGPGGSFDSKAMLFSQLNVTASIPAPVSVVETLVGSGSSSSVQSLFFTGVGGSLTTAQPITTSLSANPGGSLGNLVLSASQGIVANITADSILGNIDATNGGISDTIKTMVGNLGRALTDANGTITGVTFVHAGGGGLTGNILVKGSLVSQLNLQSGLNGVVAADGDLGVIQTNNGIAVTNADGSLIRFGGIVVSTGGLNGQVIVLGNAFGDISVTGGLGGRIAVQGNPGEFGLASFRYGILGNVAIGGGISTTGAVVSAGLIGDDAANNINNDTKGTHLTISGNDKGILAAGEDINFGTTGSLNQSGIFENAKGSNLAAIDAIFINNNLPLDVTDPTQLNLLIQDLLALTVVNGKLTGTTP